MIRLIRRLLRPKPQPTTWDMLQAELDRSRVIRLAGLEAVRKALDLPA